MSVGGCACGNPGCRWCDPNAWMEERRLQVGKIDIKEDKDALKWPDRSREWERASAIAPQASLRDQMAMAALEAVILSESEERHETEGWADDAAYLAYEYADAMLRARKND